MQHMESFNEIEAKLKMTLDALSNGEGVEVKDEWIEAAAEEFKAALYKQLKPVKRQFGLRASNVGRPTCQLQMEQAEVPTDRRDYNDILRRTFGDTIETLMNLMLKAAQVNITGQKTRTHYEVNGRVIDGEDDLEIDGKVYDIKSASGYAFNNKWNDGWRGVFYGDTFGYVDQLYLYADGKPERMGGWIVVDKSSGEVKVVEAQPTLEQLKEIKDRIAETDKTINDKQPFRRCFQEEDEVFYRKPTGNRVLATTCQFCDYLSKCWPTARRLPQQASKAANPKAVWYTHVETQ
jgi:hypothetical protein